MVPIGELAVQIGYDLGPLDSLAGEVSGAIRQQGQGLQQLGGQLSMGLTAPILAFAGASVFAANAMGEAMGNVATLIPGQTAKVEALNGAIQDMAVELGAMPADLRDGAYQVLSAFGDTSDAVSILNSNARAARAGLATTTEAIALTSAVTKGFGDTSGAAVEQAADLALSTVRLGQTTFPELAASIGRTVPLMKALGGTSTELFALFSTLTGVTGNTAEVSTQIAGLQRSFVTQTDAMSEAMAKAGYTSAQTMIAELGLAGALEKVVATTNGTTEQVGALFGSSEALTAVLALTGAQAGDFTAKLAEMEDAGGATATAFREATSGPAAFGFGLAQLKASGVVALEEVGEGVKMVLAPLLPVFRGVTVGVTALARGFQELPAPVQGALAGLVGLAVAAGPILGTMGAFKGIMAALGPVLASTAVPILPLVAGAAALGAVAYTVYQNWDKIVAFLDGPASGVVGKVKDAWEAGVNALAVVWENVAPVVGTVVGEWWDTSMFFLGKIVDFAQWAVAGIGQLWDTYGASIMATVSGMWDTLSFYFTVGVQTIGGVVSFFLAALRGDWQGALGYMQGMASRAWSTIQVVTLSALDNMLAGLERFTGAIPVIGEAVSGARGQLQGLIADARSAATAGAEFSRGAGFGVPRGALSGLADLFAPGGGSTPPAAPPAAPPPGAGAAPDADKPKTPRDTARDVRTVRDVLAELTTDLAGLGRRVDAGLVRPFEAATERVGFIRGALEEALNLGLRPGTAEALRLTAQLTAAKETLAGLGGGVEDTMALIGLKAETGLLTPLQAAEARVEAIENALEALVTNGLTSASEQTAIWQASLVAARNDLATLKVTEQLATDLEMIGLKAQAGLLDPLEQAEARAEGLRSALMDAVEGGLNPGGEKARELRDAILEAEAAAATLDLATTLANVGTSLTAGLVTPLDAIQQSLDATQQAFQTALVERGLDPASEAAGEFRARIAALKVELDGAQAGAAATSAWDAYGDAINAAGASFDAFGDRQALVNAELQASQALFNALVATGMDPMGDALESLRDRIGVLSDASTAFFDLGAAIESVMDSATGALVDGLAEIIGSGGGFADAAKGVLSSVLGTIGDIAVKEGAILIAAGLGIEALKLALSTLNGAAAIGAGAALIAIGIGAKAGVRALAGGGGGSGSSGGGTYGGNFAAPPLDSAGDQLAQQQTDALGRIAEGQQRQTEALEALGRRPVNVEVSPRQAVLQRIEADSFEARTSS